MAAIPEISGAVQQWKWVATITLVIALLIRLLLVRYRTGLSKIPGPLTASVSSVDRITTVLSGHQFEYHLKYHQKYGPLVRVGPKHVSFSNANLIPLIYGITSRFYKVRQYPTSTSTDC